MRSLRSLSRNDRLFINPSTPHRSPTVREEQLPSKKGDSFFVLPRGSSKKSGLFFDKIDKKIYNCNVYILIVMII